MSAESIKLSVLVKGFEALQRSIAVRKNHLTESLQKNEHISVEDEAWLDNEANLVLESQLIHKLEGSPGEEKSMEGLDEMEREVIRKLRIAAGDLPKPVERKRKRMWWT